MSLLDDDGALQICWWMLQICTSFEAFCDTLLSWIQCCLLCFIFVHVWYFARKCYIYLSQVFAGLFGRCYCFMLQAIVAFAILLVLVCGFGWIGLYFAIVIAWLWLFRCQFRNLLFWRRRRSQDLCLFVCFTIDTANYCICNYICNVVLHCFWLFFFSHMIAKKRLGRYIITIAVDSITHEKSEWSTLHPRIVLFRQ